MIKTGTILVVDDEPGLAALYEAWLQESYAVRTANGGKAALELIDREVDVVLLDRQMPGLSGGEVLTELRGAGYDCPVALVTAAKPTVDAMDLGYDEYLLKPVERDGVLDCVRRLDSIADFDAQARKCVRAVTTAAILTDNFAAEAGQGRAVVERCEREFRRAATRTAHPLSTVFGDDGFPRPPWSLDGRPDASRQS